MEGSERQFKDEGGVSVIDTPFFVAAAHELKSPLALIRQLSLALEAGDCSLDEASTMIRRISLTSERALRLTTDLTRSSRLKDSLFSLEPVNPMSLCEEVVDELQPLYAAKGRRLVVAERHRPLLAVANKDLLRRILINFADNALHYSVGSEPVVVKASAHSGGTKIRLAVRDHGPALPSQLWRRLDTSLGVSSQPLHNRPQSSGLGLTIARRFAETMMGSVGATRHQDGATFYVDLTASTQLRLL
ncbi:putative Histidine kinase [Candidatus Saccharimonas aalborgensis]|jgi:two-component system sensor histidine kinase MtrB|uniref:histidine kinase n=1 Tax=Candidatus Saccharimonas aalborgensis TaxID=1332188 RepID=R4PNE4_9BACT|nr:HAMP domain-containing sensor histidine kinase [Candidatus Saccharimonas aalborgensis]AGL62484.1 putative Histidine kinase [Candidatus Saccharimonas aalborgensis]MBP7775446.1 HAMP domain-containing histidine kinase [Candidatus Saccharimonas sp.]QQS67986.1 MAG: HAMP domain-containing histidine kinase [Candidatus Saccharibacteria bacterium]QQS70327.1 MAG: HAMP domain-containing histidine kinase [Candidatus Saccharibacteria bacterium]